MPTTKPRVIVTFASDDDLTKAKKDAQAESMSLSAWLLSGRNYPTPPERGTNFKYNNPRANSARKTKSKKARSDIGG